jgi:hypothetical protein
MSQIEARRYAAIIKSAAVTETQNGKAQVSFDLILEDQIQFTGNKSLEGGAYPYTLNALRKFGFNDDWDSLGAQLEGRECSVVIELEPGQKDPSRLFPKLAFIDPPRNGASGKPAEGGLLARLKAQARTITRPADAPPPNPKTAPAPRSAPAPTRAPAAPINDEDVPF